MAGWNLPDGCTGREFQIAGPDAEWEAEYPCDNCGLTQEFAMFGFEGSIWGECMACGAAADEELIANSFDSEDYDGYWPEDDCT